MNILRTTKIYNNRIYLPKEIRGLLEVSNGDVIIFAKNNNEIIITNNKEKKPDRFNVSTSDI